MYIKVIIEFLYLLIISSLSHAGKSVRVGFQLDGVARTDSFLKYKKSLPDMTQFSLCFRIQIIQYRPSIPVMSYSSDVFDNEIILSFEYSSSILLVSSTDLPVTFNIPHKITLDKEDSVCISVNLENSSYKGTINELVINGIDEKSKKSGRNITVSGNGYLYFGQEQDSPDGGFQKSDCVSGYLSDFTFYNRLLTEEEMMKYTSCFTNETISRDNLLVDFSDKDQFEVSNAVFSYEDTWKLQCDIEQTFKIFFPGERTYFESKYFCHGVGGRIVIPMNDEENSQLFDFIVKHRHICSHQLSDLTWLGVTANVTEKYYQDDLTKKALSYDNTRNDLSPQWIKKPCLTFFGDITDLEMWRGVWNPTPCSYTTCVVCHFDDNNLFSLRGLCSKSVFDRQYFLATKNSSDYFKGFFYSFIDYFSYKNGSSEYVGYWKVFRRDKPKARAILNVTSESEYPIGTKLWYIAGDVCEYTSGYFGLTVCHKDQFTCHDGSCINLEQRCDSQVDCQDATDELDCFPLLLPEKYSESIAPPRGKDKKPTIITFFSDIHSIQSFDLAGFKFMTEMTLILTWRDPRIKFKNLKSDIYLNIIEATEVNRMPWIPNPQFLGDQNSSSKINAMVSSLYGRRISDPLPDNDEYVSTVPPNCIFINNSIPDELFLGSSNDLVLKKKFLLTTSCQFDLTYFPFDSQICNIITVIGNGAEDYVQFSPYQEGVIFTGKPRLLQYYVKAVGYFEDENGNGASNAIKIEFQGLSSFFITNTYIPTLIMLVIGYLPFYFVMDDFTDRIVVSVTSLLVEATFMNQLTVTVPNTAYMKMIDIWCIFCISVLFSITLLLTLINYLKRTRQPKKSKPIRVSPVSKDVRYYTMKEKSNSNFLNSFGIVFYPVVVSLFVLGYILVAVNKIDQNVFEDDA